MKRVSATIATVLLVLFGTPHTGAQTSVAGVRVAFTTELPTLGGHGADATAISELGHVVGVSATADGVGHAFLWTEQGGMIDLTPAAVSSTAFDVNDRGEAVGAFTDTNGDLHPFVWSPERGLVELPLFGERSGAAIDINNAGDVLGVVAGGTVIWSRDRGVIRLPAVAGEVISAESMNEFSEVSGVIRGGSVVRWSPESGVSLLGFQGTSFDINERGDVVGVANFEGDFMEPFLWTRTGIRRLLPEPIPGNEGAVTGVNNLRHVVGFAELRENHPTGWLAMTFLWTPAAGVIPLAPANVEETGMGTTTNITDHGAIAGVAEGPSGVGAVVWQLETSAAQIAGAMRVRISESASRGVLQRGHARALLAKLDQVERDLQRRRSATSHARSLRDQVFKFTRTGAFADTQGPPMRQLATVLVEKVRRPE